MRRRVLVMVFALLAGTVYGQQVKWYNTDSLLLHISGNDKIRHILNEAEALYKRVHLDTGNISVNAFKVAYLEKRMIDRRMIRIKHRHRYKNKKILTVADLTKHGNAKRFAVVDVINERLLYDTLVSQGSGKGEHKNDKYNVPTHFSNTVNSEVSSLGLIVTKKARQPENPCHFCKYAISQKHKCTIILLGMERGINDNVKKRDIVMHTTGSKELTADEKKRLKIDDTSYRVAETECKCYRTSEDGSVKKVGAYASACGLAENNGYIGQSNGCLVLPEDDHVEIMETIKRKSLIFIYSNVVNDGYDYFGDSPIIQKVIKYASNK